MVFHYSYGQLGNQLFHYAFLKTVTKPGQLIVTSNFAELSKLCLLPDKIIHFRHAVFKYSVPILKLAAWLRLFSWYRPLHVSSHGVNFENNQVVYKKGVLPVTVLFPGYFQSEAMFNPECIAHLAIREEHLEKARKYLEGIPENCHQVFVHVRRGDYLTIDFHGLRDTALPVSYYLKQIEWFRQNIANPFFIFLTDDYSYVMENFGHIEPSLVSRDTKYTDLAIMSLCRSGIMSNSSFSWWGGYFMKNREHLFGPRHWLGFAKGIEIPQGVFPEFVTPVDVIE
jgi:hypothetical protein